MDGIVFALTMIARAGSSIHVQEPHGRTWLHCHEPSATCGVADPIMARKVSMLSPAALTSGLCQSPDSKAIRMALLAYVHTDRPLPTGRCKAQIYQHIAKI